MTQSRMRAFFVLGTLVLFAILVFGFNASAEVATPNFKEYRDGSVITIKGKTYLLATNNSSVEIMEFNQASALVPTGELRLPQKIKDVVTINENDQAFAIVTTGRYLYRIKITDPTKMEIVLKHDNYQYSRGRIHTGSVEALATNGKVLITGGQYGVRAMGLTNLLVEKYYHYERVYGVAVNNQVVYALGEQKAYAYQLSNGKKITETEIKNADKQLRQPAVNNSNFGFVISDNMIKEMNNGKIKAYTNPDTKVIFSYAAAATDKYAYYANGYGITKFDNNLKKLGFAKTANSKLYGERAWAVGVLTATVNGKEKVIVMNKSGILVMTPDLVVTSQYKNSNNIQYSPAVIVSFNREYFMTNQVVTAQIAGFYPNELIKLSINGKYYQLKSNNLGEAMINFTTPAMPGNYLIDIDGKSSELNYQVTKSIR